jgi:hypothetical protein
MDSFCKPDWEEAKNRFRAWWAHEIIDRCCIQILAPKAVTQAVPFSWPAKNLDRWTDFNFYHELNQYAVRSTFYGGEAFPVWHPGYYPFTNSLAAFMGCPVTLRENTGWVYPIIEEGDLTEHDYHTLNIDPENQWLKFDERMHSFSAEDSAGEFIPRVWIYASSGDTLAAMRGTEKLLMDLADCADYVKQIDRHIVKQSIDLYDKYYKIVYRGRNEGISDWFSIWAESRYSTLQNDFAYMISPKMFIDVFLPSIEMQTNYFDYTNYHCDGVGNFQHLDALCSLPRLTGIQVLPGEGKPSPLHYADSLKKVQDKGKNLVLNLNPDEVETALQMLSSKGLFIQTSCNTEEEAKYILANMHKWTRE